MVVYELKEEARDRMEEASECRLEEQSECFPNAALEEDAIRAQALGERFRARDEKGQSSADGSEEARLGSGGQQRHGRLLNERVQETHGATVEKCRCPGIYDMIWQGFPNTASEDDMTAAGDGVGKPCHRPPPFHMAG
ncbi:hypothetical protein E6O75_ATG04416 [Venturia nashicola]|uniref:Uncharacterized protein n=1 Tax=Venturia nashicola TaxID=86259 RepID=A0A4Z1PI46_9PEZI|nr:hypothetical protein E6O75_ATG04416 [Venturia nashicola]